MRADEIYLQNLRLIERIAGFVARRSRLNADETSEFMQEVRVRLLDDDYAIIRKFEGRSAFPTYLTTVIMRLFHQWRAEQWGKWRPSAEARRLGDKAIVLERLISRDGLTFDEAVRTLTTPASSPYTAAEIEAIYLRLPVRSPRPVLVADDSVPDAIAVESEGPERIEKADVERTARKATHAVDALIQEMDPEDRLILQMRFWDSQKVPDIARILRLDQKKLYKRLDKLFAVLRRGLESAGLTRDDVGTLLQASNEEFHFGVFARPGLEASGLSHSSGGADGRSKDLIQ